MLSSCCCDDDPDDDDGADVDEEDGVEVELGLGSPAKGVTIRPELKSMDVPSLSWDKGKGQNKIEICMFGIGGIHLVYH